MLLFYIFSSQLLLCDTTHHNASYKLTGLQWMKKANPVLAVSLDVVLSFKAP